MDALGDKRVSDMRRMSMTHEAGIEAGTDALAAYINGSGVFLEVGFEKALQAYLSASGMVLVPREMTDEMMKSELDKAVYKAYLADAPNPFKSKP